MKKFALVLAAAVLFAIPAPARAATIAEQRTAVQHMESKVLDQLYRIHPRAEQRIDDAAGYAVFSTADVAALFFSGAYGHGIAHNNATGDETYMKMASAGVGLGLGAKDYRLVFVFDNARVYNDFVQNGLDLSARADLAAKQGSKGAAVGGEQDVLPGVRVYQLTKTGLMAQAMLRGTTYWRDAELNGDTQSRNDIQWSRHNVE